MATQLLKTVMPSGGDYTSLEACMNANEQNLVTADKYFDVEIDGDWSSGADTTAVIVHNYSTDDTRYINIYTTVTARHIGVRGTTFYRIDPPANNHGITVTGGTQVVRITGLAVTGIIDANYFGMNIGAAGGGTTTSKVDKCLVYDITGTGGIGIYIDGYYRAHLVTNNFVIGCTTGMKGRKVSDTVLFANNTVYGCTTGMNASTEYGSPHYILAKNNLCNGNTTDYTGTADSASTNNLSEDTTAYPLNTYYTSKAVSFVSETSGSENLHLADNDTLAKDLGVDLSATFTDDIDGVTRTGTWDIGADEFVAGAVGETTQLIMCS